MTSVALLFTRLQGLITLAIPSLLSCSTRFVSINSPFVSSHLSRSEIFGLLIPFLHGRIAIVPPTGNESAFLPVEVHLASVLSPSTVPESRLNWFGKARVGAQTCPGQALIAVRF